MSTIKRNSKQLSNDAKDYEEFSEANKTLNNEIDKTINKINEINNKFKDTTKVGVRALKNLQEAQHDSNQALTDYINIQLKAKNEFSKYGELTDEGIKRVIRRREEIDKLKESEEKLKESLKNTSKENENYNTILDSYNKTVEERNRLENKMSGLNGAERMLLKDKTGHVNNLIGANKKYTDSIKDVEKAESKANESSARNAKLLETRKKYWDITTRFGKDFINGLKETALFYADYEDKMYKSGRAIGFSQNQIEAYTKQVGKDIGTIGVKYGLTVDEIIAMQGRIVQATGRAIIMNKAQKDQMAANSKVFGEEITDSVISKMDNMGAGIEQAGTQLAAIQEGVRYAGLDASKFAKDFASNLEWAQKNVNFKDGVDGVRKMTEKSEILKINMQSIMSAAEKMNNVQGSIESSARMQMLGGNFARNFSDPMRVMYESQSDPEALFKRIIDSAKGMSSFNMKTGQASTNYYGRASLKAAAEATGLSYDDLLQATQTQAKLNALGGQMNGNLTEDQKMAIANRAQRNANGVYEATWYDSNGKETTKNISQMSAEDIKAMTDSAKRSEDINGNVYQITKFNKDFKDKWQSFQDQFISKYWDTARDLTAFIGEKLDWLASILGKIPQWMQIAVGALIVSGSFRAIGGRAANWGIGKVLNLAKWGIRSIYRTLIGNANMFGSASFGSATRGLGSGILKGGINGFTEEMAHNSNIVTDGTKAASHGKLFNSFFKRTKFGDMGLLGKIGTSLGIGINVGEAVYNGIRAYEAGKDEDKALNIISSKGGLRGFKNNNVAKANAISNIVTQNQNKTVAIGNMIGSGIGIMSNFIPFIGPALSATIMTLAPFLGTFLGKSLSKNNATVAMEEQAKDRGTNYLNDTTRLNMNDLSQTNVATATIKSSNMMTNIYEFMVQTWGTHAQKQSIDDGIRKARGETVDTNHGFFNGIWNRSKDALHNLTGGLLFANGGIVKTHAANGALIHGNYEQGDREIIAANSGEMILNKKQQGALFSFISKLYDSPTEIARRTAAFNGINPSNNIGGNLNINFSGTIKLDAGGQKYDFKELMKDATFVKELSNIITRQMSKNMNGKYDKNNPVSRVQSYTFRRGVGYNNA